MSYASAVLGRDADMEDFMNNESAHAQRKHRRIAKLACLACTAVLATAIPAQARMKVWDLTLGSSLEQMPALQEFKGYACGSNGGPPLKVLKGWEDFSQCAPEASGLHEVYFEYDDEDEYIARAHEDIRLGRDIGTVDKSFPVIASALFDDAGTLEGIRLVTDPRFEQQPDNEWASLRPREEHYLLGAYLAGQFNITAAADCVTVPLAKGESAVAGRVVKRDCQRTDSETGVRYVLQQRYFRKAGQGDHDPHTGALTTGQYESTARAEVLVDAAMPPKQ